jgi:LysR family glycine cleavage system transcriptional activator
VSVQEILYCEIDNLFQDARLRTTLPPLNSLKAFEATARHGSFLRAAKELGVTAPAVSQQVKRLEAHLGRELFLRHNNAIVLTDAGRAAYPAVAEGFDKIASITRMGQAGRLKTRLVVSALPSVAFAWLGEQLGAFAKAHHGLTFELRAEEDPVEFARHDIDLRLCYGAQLYPGLVVEPLAVDRVAPLCAPEWLAAQAGLAGPEDLEDHDLIHIDWGPTFASHPTWTDWFAAAGIERRPSVGQGHLVGLSSLAVDFAAAGMGIALCQRLLAERQMVTGALVNPFGPELKLKDTYCLAYPHAKAKRPQLKALIAWLRTQLPAD